ncbi:alpha/beta hydrolase family protein, partial [Brevibacterium aurantiacum]|uniref:alpha/beta hydrolase family protein n=1 Tax=Brevibacterium aurantiacum TaxID=273384 RepID=UPI0018675F1E
PPCIHYRMRNSHSHRTPTRGPNHYNCLAYDGPGQGAALREQHLFFRHDWEQVLTPVVDYARARIEIDSQRVVAYGYSLGGLLVARAAAFEHRLAAIVLDDGLFDYFEASTKMVPHWILDSILTGRDSEAEQALSQAMIENTSLRWALRNGVWTFGADSKVDYVRRSQPYTLKDVVDRISTPALIFDPDNDFAFAGEPQRLHQALPGSSELVTLREADGLGERCSYGGRSTVHQIMFDWLDATL